MVIRGSRKLLIKQLDTSLIQENFPGARRRDAHQIGPRVMVFDADRVFAHGILQGDLSSLPYKTVRRGPQERARCRHRQRRRRDP